MRLDRISKENLLRLMKEVSDINSFNTHFAVQKQLSPQMITRLTKSVLVTSTWSSNRIEGNKLSDEEVDKLYKKLRITKLKTRDEQEVGGYIDLLELVFNVYADMEFTEWLILQFHSMMLKYTDKDAWHRGKYKFWPNRVEARDRQGNLVKAIFNPTEPALVPHEIKALVERTQDHLKKWTYPSLFIIGNFIFEYLAIHPFQDGNGRTSRILTNLLLLKAGYKFDPFVSHEKIIENNKADYYKALNIAQETWKTDHEDITPWLFFFLKVVRKQAETAVKLIEMDEVEAWLSDRQKAVRKCVLKNDGVSRKEIIDETGSPAPTVNQALQKLLDMKKIIRKWEGRGVKYFVAE